MSLRAIAGISVMVLGSAAYAQPTCLDAIQMQREAVDMQWSTQFHESVWPDGITQWPRQEATHWTDVGPRGGGQKYRTYHREIRSSPVLNSRQTILLKAIVTRVASDGRYSGDYTVNKITYVCESRAGEWRIFNQIVHRRTDLVNSQAAAAFHASGGWDGNTETMQ